MSELTLTTFDWVPEVPRGYVRDIRVRWALDVDARERNDAIDVLPPLSQFGLQRQLFAHRNKAHDLVGRILLNKGREP